jgi:DNA replication terminus site-binding protein
MATYDLIERLNSTFREIEHELLTLTERLQTCRLLARASLPCPVAKGAEHDPLDTIDVKQHIGKAALELAMKHYRHLLSSSSLNSAAARRPCGCRA